MYVYVSSLVATSDGGFAILFTRRVNSHIPIFTPEFWLVKTDAFGNLEWNQTYTIGTRTENVNSLVATSDGGYAFTCSDALVKTDSLGNIQWEKTYDGSNWGSLIATPDGGYALAGSTSSSGAVLAGTSLVKTDALGNIEWNKTYGGEGTGFVSSLVGTSDGGYAIAAITDSFGAGLTDAWLVKTDALGNMLWNQTYGGTGEEQPTSLIATSDGGFAMDGLWHQALSIDSSVWLIKTDPFGNVLWNQTYGGTASEMAFSLIATADGGYAISGATNSFGAGGDDFWLVKTDENGVAPEYSSWVAPLLVLAAVVPILFYRKRLLRARS